MKAGFVLRNVIVALLIAATFNLSWQLYRAAQDAMARERLYEEHEIIACRFGPDTDESARFLIELGLLLAFAGCLVGRRAGKAASLLGLLFAAGVYVPWWRFYFVMIDAWEADAQTVDHLFFLYHAVWLDLCIAAFLPVLIVWQMLAPALPPLERVKYS